MLDKDELRRELRRCLAEVPPDSFHTEGLRAAECLRSQPLWGRYRTLLVFLSMEREIDTGPLLEAALAEGKAVFAPRTGETGLRFWRVSSPAGPWEQGPFGIRKPAASPGGALRAADFPALVITPGLGFDRQGRRLGRGGAYYDRFFAELDTPVPSLPYFALGLCIPAQLVSTVPVDRRDKPMNGLCTGSFFTLVPDNNSPGK